MSTSREFAGEMYELEAKLDKHLFEAWEEYTGDIWRDELDNAQDWAEAYQYDPMKSYALKMELKNLVS